MDVVTLASDAMTVAQSLPDTTVLAQIDTSGLENTTTQAGDAITSFLRLIIGIVGATMASILLVKALNNLKKKQQNDAIKDFVFMALTVVLTIMGVVGAANIVEIINPVTETGGNTDFLN